MDDEFDYSNYDTAEDWASSWGGLQDDGSINWSLFAATDPYGLDWASYFSPEQEWAAQYGVLDEDGNIDWGKVETTFGISADDINTPEEVKQQLGESLYNLAYNYGGDTSIVSNLFNKVKGLFTDKNGNVNWGSVAGAVGGIAGLAKTMGSSGASNQRVTGYRGGIPSYTAVRERVADTYDPTRRPGSGGQRYFSDVTYATPANVEAARTSAQEQATGLAALNKANIARQERPKALKFYEASEATPVDTTPASEVIKTLPVAEQKLAVGGIAELRKGRYLRGDSDGMADKVVSNIDGKQPARLSHGEFVVPADVVSHIGNGNSDAGAKRLYTMMDRIRQARTGTKKQGKQINPNKYMPA